MEIRRSGFQPITALDDPRSIELIRPSVDRIVGLAEYFTTSADVVRRL